MRQYLSTMVNMIGELTAAEHVLTDEQQIQAVIRTLPRAWEHMRVFLTHDDTIHTFDDIARHLEMEEDRLLNEKITPKANIASSSSQHRTSGSRRKRGPDDYDSRRPAEKAVAPAPQKANSGKKKFTRGMREGKKVKAQKAGGGFTCGKVGHFARDCTEQKEPRNI